MYKPKNITRPEDIVTEENAYLFKWLYDKEDKVDGFLEALDLYEVMIQNDKQFKEFVRLAAVSRGVFHGR